MKRQKAVLLAIGLASIAALAIEYGNIWYKAIAGTNTYELWEQGAFGFYKISGRTALMLNYAGSPAWTYKSESYFDPPATPNGYIVTKVTTTITGTKAADGEYLSQPMKHETQYDGPSTPPNDVHWAPSTAPSGIGYIVGYLIEYETGDDGIFRKNITNVPSVTFRVQSPDDIPAPFTVNVYSVRKNSTEVGIQHYTVDYMSKTFTWRAPGGGLWSLGLITISRP